MFRMNLVEFTLTAVARHTAGVHYVRRGGTRNSPAFDLAYVRGNRGGNGPPVVVIPGGPGLGSVLPYRTLRALAVRAGVDLIMVEHRGVGISRHDLAGNDLPPSAMNVASVVDDIAAVLDREGIDQAIIVGSSYGSYVASCFGVAYPERVAGMLLDSALQSANHLDLERAVIRALFWEGDTAITAQVHKLVSSGIEERTLLDVARSAYELGGTDLLLPVLQSRIRHKSSPAWWALERYSTRDASLTSFPAIYEFDLVGTIAFRELGYGAPQDGLPLDPALTYSNLAARYPPFGGELYDLSHEIKKFDWPLILLSGAHDLRTPPAIARHIAETAPDAVLVPIENGHSALDTHPVVLLNAIRWLAAGRHRDLPGIAAQLNELPRRGFAARLPALLHTALRFGG